jgi:hypothetical protein
MAKAPRHRAAAPRRPTRARRSPALASIAALPPSTPGPKELGEGPTGHAVCRQCGRILRLELAAGDGPNLEAFADRRPPGWSSETITLTVTGLCPECRAGGGTPR